MTSGITGRIEILTDTGDQQCPDLGHLGLCFYAGVAGSRKGFKLEAI
jgi:hypothetical protein